MALDEKYAKLREEAQRLLEDADAALIEGRPMRFVANLIEESGRLTREAAKQLRKAPPKPAAEPEAAK